METDSLDYTERLVKLTSVRWRRWLHVQAPYRWNVRRLCVGRTLDIGCGIGRNLDHLRDRAIGIDHNIHSVEVARARGLVAYTPTEFANSGEAKVPFDSILIAHVLEHLDQEDADALVEQYLPHLRPGGRFVAITPQERLYKKDSTHVRWVDGQGLAEHADRAGLIVDRLLSFPFFRAAGSVFPYNEFVLVAHMPNR